MLPDMYPCPYCKGGRKRGAMFPTEKQDRARQLRIAKAKGEPPPPLPYSCSACGSKGWTSEPFKGTLWLDPNARL